MMVYWTKERFKDIGIAFTSVYIVMFIFFVSIAWIHNDLSIVNIIFALEISLIVDLFAMCAGGLGAFIKMSDKNE